MDTDETFVDEKTKRIELQSRCTEIYSWPLCETLPRSLVSSKHQIVLASVRKCYLCMCTVCMRVMFVVQMLCFVSLSDVAHSM